MRYRSKYDTSKARPRPAWPRHPNAACDPTGMQPEAYVSINGTRVQYSSEGVRTDYAEATPGRAPFPDGHNCSANASGVVWPGLPARPPAVYADLYNLTVGSAVENCKRQFGIDYATGEPRDEEGGSA